MRDVKNRRKEIYLIVYMFPCIVIASHKFLRRFICGKCGHTTMGENYVVVMASSRRKWPDKRVTARYLIDLSAENPAAAFPIDRRECDRRTEFPGHPEESLAVSRQETLQRESACGHRRITILPCPNLVPGLS